MKLELALGQRCKIDRRANSPHGYHRDTVICQHLSFARILDTAYHQHGKVRLSREDEETRVGESG